MTKKDTKAIKKLPKYLRKYVIHDLTNLLKTNHLIFWFHGEILIMPDDILKLAIDPINNVLLNIPCVDLAYLTYSIDNAIYGKWVISSKSNNPIDWHSVPYEDFPGEFKTSLLLLNI